jgi:hypothetical protein
MNKLFWDLVQFVIIALLAFSMFAWIEVKFFLPTLEKDIVEHLPHDTVYIVSDSVRVDSSLLNVIE